MSNKWIYDKVNSLVKKYQTRDPEETYLNYSILILIYMNPTKTLLGMYRVILKNRFIFIPNNVGSLKKDCIGSRAGT